MKERHTGTRVTFLLLLLIPWESDRWKRRLVCQIQRLSNRGLELPFCKQHLPPALYHPHQKSAVFLHLSPSPPCFDSHTLSPAASLLLPDSFGFYLSSVCSTVVAIISADFFSLPLTCYCDSQPTPSPQTFP